MKTKSVVSAGPLERFVRRYRNARTSIKQIRAGEWLPEWNIYSKSHLTAGRDDLELWIGNGPFFCEIQPRFRHPQWREAVPAYFGLFWRHYVWWAAARRMKTKADRGYVRSAVRQDYERTKE